MATKFERLYNDINDELTDIKDINKYTNIPTIAVIIGIFTNVPIPLTIK